MKLRRLSALIASTVVIALVLPAAASANAFSEVSAALMNSSTSTVPCGEFSNAVLEAALQEQTSYADEYQGSFASAVQATIDEQAAGSCDHKPNTGGPALRPASLTGGGVLPASITSHTAAGLPLVVALILLVAAVIVLAGAGVFLIAVMGWDPRAGRVAGHSLTEAEDRLGARWVEFIDRFRR